MLATLFGNTFLFFLFFHYRQGWC